jgi:hypothetical protein
MVVRRFGAWCLMSLGMVGSVRAEEPTWVDARVSTFAQYFQQALVPGLPGAVGRVEAAYPLTASAFLRFGGVGLLGTPDAIGGELSGWGSVGPRDGSMGDGDVTTAYGQYRTSRVRVKVGRQVTLPGSSRYVRFDGAAAGVSLGVVELDAYAGWVALPRWNQVRGANLLGFVGDGLKDPLLLEAQSRAGQITAGARAGLRLPGQTRVAVAFHEQRDGVGVAFRSASTDLTAQPLPWLGTGARLTMDLRAFAASEARAWVDLTWFQKAPVAIDYSYQSPALLLPQSSVLAAFGGVAWHELGAEATVRALPSLKVVTRGAGQLFEGARLGGRGQGRVVWTPGIDGRLTVLAELTRLLAQPSGYTELRLAARYRAATTVSTSLDTAVFFYDLPIHGVTTSMTGIASVEWGPRTWLRLMLSATALRSPFAAFEAQGLARAIFELDPISAGGLP